MTDLLNCPFCGGPAEMWRAHDNRPAWVACMGECAVLVGHQYKTDAEAIAAWNTRAPDPDLDAHIGAVLEQAAGEVRALAFGRVSDVERVCAAILAIRPDALQALERVLRKARVNGLREAQQAASLYNVNRGAGSATARAIVARIQALIAAEKGGSRNDRR